MAGAAGEPSAKRAKVDEADEEEDPLVRRKEEVVRLLGRARKGKDNARAKKELVTLCDDFEAKNEKLFRRLLPELWQKILDENVQQNDLLALAMTCRFFREKQKDLGKKVETNLDPWSLVELRKSGEVASQSLGWFQWVCDTMEILPGFKDRSERVKGAMYEGVLLNYAACQGSVEVLKWLMEEKGWELNRETDMLVGLGKGTGWYAGLGGSVEILEHLKGRGYEFDEEVCKGAAQGGHLEVLKFLRGLDPPCPWDEETCEMAAMEGRLDVLKFLRSQDPPCPWNVQTCSEAALGGHLEVLKWLRSQDPPCPWDVGTCASAAKGGHLEALKFLRGLDPPCPWDVGTCASAAKGGHLEALKFLRGLDPPCPWSEMTCSVVASGGHLEVLKWLRAQDPPCPWSAGTCSQAARMGHLDVLKWARAQDPPCPWNRHECRMRASMYGQLHIINWIDQQEDEIVSNTF